jgi:hypothetical protein
MTIKTSLPARHRQALSARGTIRGQRSPSRRSCSARVKDSAACLVDRMPGLCVMSRSGSTMRPRGQPMSTRYQVRAPDAMEVSRIAPGRARSPFPAIALCAHRGAAAATRAGRPAYAAGQSDRPAADSLCRRDDGCRSLPVAWLRSATPSLLPAYEAITQEVGRRRGVERPRRPPSGVRGSGLGPIPAAHD